MIEISSLALPIARWLLATALHSAVLIALVSAALLLAGRRIAPAWRHALWLIVVVRLCLPYAPAAPIRLASLLPFTAFRAGGGPSGSDGESTVLIIQSSSPGGEAGEASPAGLLQKPLATGPAAPGSLAGLEAHPCHGTSEYWDQRVPSIVYLESLRRNVPGSWPHWLHLWSDDGDRGQAPLPPDPRVEVTLEDVEGPGGPDDRVRLRLSLTTSAPLRAFSLVLEAEGDVLRVPFTCEVDETCAFDDYLWEYVEGVSELENVTGEVNAGVHPATYLITGGKFVLSNFFGSLENKAYGPGEIPLEVGAWLPRGCRSGRHTVRLLPGSEVLLDDGSLIAPTLAREGTVTLAREVAIGAVDGLPPLSFPEGHAIGGKIEFRLTNSDGNPADPGAPVAFGFPGDVVVLRAQMRTETPLNAVSAHVYWPGGALVCSEGPMSLWTNPDDGELYLPVATDNLSRCRGRAIGLDGSVQYDFGTAGGWWSDFQTALFPDRPLEYFKPLGEWVNLFGGFLAPELDLFAPPTELRPGTITILGHGFLRGDSNADGKIDLSDAVSTLGYLFLGKAAPSCLDAADADDSGAVEIADAIVLLGTLFRGENAIPTPYPDCGADPTADDGLGCAEGCAGT